MFNERGSWRLNQGRFPEKTLNALQNIMVFIPGKKHGWQFGGRYDAGLQSTHLMQT